MSSEALLRWRDQRASRLDRLRDAHTAFVASRPGRRYETTELNHALLLRLASEFQGFARELHDEAATVLAAALAAGDPALRSVLTSSLTAQRRLDRGNAEPVGLNQDFQRVGVELWTELATKWPGRGPRHRRALTELNHARNAIAHDDERRLAAVGRSLTLATFTDWHRELDHLAAAMDDVVGARVGTLLGVAPW